MRKALLSMAMTATVALATTFAQAAPIIVNEASLGVGSTFDRIEGIEKLNGGYREMLTINNDGSFAASAFASFAQYYDTTGANMPTGGPGKIANIGNLYRLIVTFDAEGVVNLDGTLSGTSGSFKLYADLYTQALTPTFGASGYDSVTVNGGTLGTDYLLLASSDSQTFGLGTGIGTEAAAFKFLFDSITLTEEGHKFFIDPNPFVVQVNVNGDIDNGLPGLLPGTYTNVLGDVSVSFAPNKVPEPGSLALFGAALAGLGAVQRRRQKQAA